MRPDKRTRTAEPIRIGVIGLGGRGQGMATLLKEHGRHLFTVAAVCDPYSHKVGTALRKLELPASAGYSAHHELLEKADVEAVLVETGSDVMVPVCCDALHAGKHVVADVPMMMTRQQCWDLIAAVERTGLVYCMGEQVRFANFALRWREVIQSGGIGAPLFVQGEYIHPEVYFYFESKETGLPDHPDIENTARDPRYRKTWRNLFVHPIKYIPHELSPLLKILDDRVTHVSCFTTDVRMYGDAVHMLDLECALMRTAKGTTIRIVNSFTAPRPGKWAHHWYHIMGTDGALETERPGWGESGEIHVRPDGSVERTHHGWTRADAPFGDSDLGHAGLETFVFQQFHDAIRHGASTELDVYAAAECALPGIIAAESAERGGERLEVPDVRPGPSRRPGAYPSPDTTADHPS